MLRGADVRVNYRFARMCSDSRRLCVHGAQGGWADLYDAFLWDSFA